MPPETGHLTPEEGQTILSMFPEKIQLALRTYALEIDFPIEAVIEMASGSAVPKATLDFWTRTR